MKISFQKKLGKLFFLFFIACISIHLQALEFTSEHNSTREQSTIKLINALNISHNLTKWQFADAIHIDENSIPHSHPILTLHTRHNKIGDVDLLLSTYLHENIHRYLDIYQIETDKVVIELKKSFPKVLVGYPKGARDEDSSYLHIIVCFLELDAIKQLLSIERYQRVANFWRGDHYTWIYNMVIENEDEITKIIRRHNLII